MTGYHGSQTIETAGVPVKAWTHGVPVEDKAMAQLRDTASLPIVWPYIAVMPDVHWGLGSTVGSVVPTEHAIVPACVGVDLGCGMLATRTTLSSSALGDNGKALFDAISLAVPHGRTDNGGANDRGAWGDIPRGVAESWAALGDLFGPIVEKTPRLDTKRQAHQLGTLGGGNHFIEICVDEVDRVWVMLHSGSRGIGNRIGSHFIEIAKKEAERDHIVLPNRDLAYLREGSDSFDDYVEALHWAQEYARINRALMMRYTLEAIAKVIPWEWTTWNHEAVSCHHNYVNRETHFGRQLWVTRKGAVSARAGELGIIPGSMGAKSFIVRGKGNPDSLHSCSHGAGRVMSRGQAKREITAEMHAADTAGVVCRQDEEVRDESPRAYKRVEDVMAAQADLVEIVATLKQAICVKG